MWNSLIGKPNVCPLVFIQRWLHGPLPFSYVCIKLVMQFLLLLVVNSLQSHNSIDPRFKPFSDSKSLWLYLRHVNVCFSPVTTIANTLSAWCEHE